MATLKDLFPSRFLTKEDIGAGQLYTIKSVATDNVGKEDEPEVKPVLYFNEAPKPFVLNMTNGQVIGALYGEDLAGWIGKQIVVFFDPTIQFKGKVTGGIRVRAPKGTTPDTSLPF